MTNRLAYQYSMVVQTTKLIILITEQLKAYNRYGLQSHGLYRWLQHHAQKCSDLIQFDQVM